MIRLRSLVTAALALASTACITFQEQSTTYHHDVARDRLLVYSTFVGIHGDDPFRMDAALPDNLTPAEKSEMLEAFTGRKFFLFNNDIRVLDIDELKRLLAEPLQPYRAEIDRAADRAKRAFWTQLATNVSITNGPFYLDPRGRLCAVQRMTVTNLAATVGAFNESWRVYAATLGADHPEWSYLAALIDAPMAFNGQELTLRYPGPPSALEASLSGAVRLVSEDGIVVLTIGKPGASRVTVSRKLARDYAPNAVGFVRQYLGMSSSFDPAADADRFFAGAAR